MGRIRNSVQVHKHLVSWTNYKLRLPRGTEGVEFYQTLDELDLRALQTSRVQRLRRDMDGSRPMEAKKYGSFEGH